MVLQMLARQDASPGKGVVHCQRQRPQRTLLYRLVEEYYPVFETQ
jgi:hypothetical protein